MPEKQNDFYFRGADIDGSGYISKNELFELVEALYKNDQLYINKLFFRAVDKDRSREIDASEFVIMAELNGRSMDESAAEAQIEKLTGGKKVLTFAQMHKALTGQDIPADTDPYDGQLEKKDTGKKGKKGNAAAAKNDKSEEAPTQPAKDNQQGKQNQKPAKDEKPTTDDQPNKNEKQNKANDEQQPAAKSGLGKTFLLIMMVLAFLAFAAFVLVGFAFLWNYCELQKDKNKNLKFYDLAFAFYRYSKEFDQYYDGRMKKILGDQKADDDDDDYKFPDAKLITGVKPDNVDFRKSMDDELKNNPDSEKSKCLSDMFDQEKSNSGCMTYSSGIFLMLSWFMAPGIGCIVLGAIDLVVGLSLLLELIGKPIRILRALLYAPVIRGICLALISVPGFGASSVLGLSAAIIGISVGGLEVILGVVEKLLVKPEKVSA